MAGLQPARNVAMGVQQGPDFDVIRLLDVEDQVRIFLVRPETHAEQVQLERLP
jgi:hypothetical protein